MELGFLEKAAEDDPEGSDRPFFASKVGGKPCWPDLSSLPAPLACKKCGKPPALLLEFHAPLETGGAEGGENEDESEEEDPRTLFLFMCTAPQCHSAGDLSPFLVLRYQGRSTPDTHPDREVPRGVDTPPPDASPLCIVCGGRGPKHCGSCKMVNYCSKEHQLLDWRNGHKRVCPDLANASLTVASLDYEPWLGVGLPEWEVVTEPEPEGACRGRGEERSERERMEDYEKYIREHGSGDDRVGVSVETLEKMVGVAGGGAKGGGKEDKIFKAFMKRIAPEHQQVSASEKRLEPPNRGSVFPL